MELKQAAGNFLQNLEALELFLKAQSTLEEINRKKDIWKTADLGEAEVDIHEKEKITNTVLFVFDIINDLPKFDDITDEYLKEINDKASEFNVSFIKKDESETNKEVKLAFNIENEVARTIFNKSIKDGDMNYRQREMVRRTALTSLMVYFESLIASVIRQRLKSNPNAFNPEDKSIKYSELKDFDTFNDALDHLMEVEVTNIMFGGLKSWIIYLKKAGLDLKEIDEYTEMINEIHNRRNLYVHNDGIVNSIYLNKVDSKYKENISKGEQIKITEDYLEEAINATKIYGTLVLIESWKKFKKEDLEKINDFAETIGFESMKKQEWEFAKYLYKFLFRETNSYADQVTVSINLWLCEKMQGNFDKIRDEILLCDVKGMKAEYQLCKFALLEMNDEFFDLLDKDPGSITKKELKTWPIFYSIREDSRINEILAQQI